MSWFGYTILVKAPWNFPFRKKEIMKKRQREETRYLCCFRTVSGVFIGLTLYGAGCVFIILMANCLRNVASLSGYSEVLYTVYSISQLPWPEPVFVIVYGAQELIPRNRLRQPMWLGPVRKIVLSYWLARLGINYWAPQMVYKYGLSWVSRV